MNNTSEDSSNGESFQDADNGATVWKRHPTANFIVSMALVLLIATCIIATIFVISSGHQEVFSEFYIIDADGKAANYPLNANLNEDIQVKIAIVNHEYSPQAYLVDITIGGSFIDTVGPITLENNQKWEQLIKFRPVSSGEGQKVEFVLTRQFQHSKEPNKPLSLQLLINVQ